MGMQVKVDTEEKVVLYKLFAFALLLVAASGCSPIVTAAGKTGPATPVREPSSVKPTADTSRVAAMLEWEGYTDVGDGDASKCKFLRVSADNSMQVGYCGQMPRTTIGIRQEMVTEMFARFAPFTYKTDKETLTFNGKGQVADGIWQRAILEWVRRTYGEVSTGHVCASCNTVFTWSLGEVAVQPGTCRIVYVLAWGYANAGTVPCKGGSAQQLHSDWLTTSEWDGLNSLTSNAAISPDTVDFELGSRVPGNEKLSGQLKDWAEDVYARLAK